MASLLPKKVKKQPPHYEEELIHSVVNTVNITDITNKYLGIEFILQYSDVSKYFKAKSQEYIYWQEYDKAHLNKYVMTVINSNLYKQKVQTIIRDTFEDISELKLIGCFRKFRTEVEETTEKYVYYNVSQNFLVVKTLYEIKRGFKL